jgi:hypothetical protein
VMAIGLVDFGQVMRTPIAGTAGARATMLPTETIVTQSTAMPTQPRQPDGTGDQNRNGLNISEDRLAATAYQVNGLVYTARQIGVPVASEAPFPERTGVRWTVLHMTDGGPTRVVAEGTIEDPRYDFFQPAIAANVAGDVVLVFNRSGPAADGAVNAFYATGTTTADDGSITFGLPRAITNSTVTDYHNTDNLWGLYSSVTPDPSDLNAFWAVQEVPVSSSAWGTQITRITVPEPFSAAAGPIVALLLLSRRCRES